MFIIGQYDRGTSIIQKNLLLSLKKTQESSEKLSSGKRINRASDDPSVTGTISRLNSKIGSLTEAIQTAGSAKTLTQTAESGLSEISNILNRVREIAVQASSSTLTSGERTTLQTEVNAYLAEIDNITKVVKFKNIKLLDGTTQRLVL